MRKLGEFVAVPLLRRRAWLLAVAWLLAPATASAQLVKCAGDGGVVYQDTPCPVGRELRDFERDPATVSIIGSRPIPGTTTRATAPAGSKRGAGTAPRKQSAPRGDPAERKYLHPGMHEGEVLARAGPPDLKSGGGSRKHARWTYLPAPADAQTLTTVLFESGKVVEVERKVMK